MKNSHPRLRLVLMTLLALLAFAANSVLCRLALTQTAIGPANFTAIRLVSGAVVLWLLVMLRGRCSTRELLRKGSWLSAGALLAYAAGFSFAYVSLPAGTGALLLFGAVQVTMVGHGLRAGDNLGVRQWMGLLLACTGVAVLLLPGVSMPPLLDALLMLGAGVAWGVYSLQGKRAGSPLDATAGNFMRAAPLALLLALTFNRDAAVDPAGIVYAIASGALASGVGYAIWYSVMPSLKATAAASVQLCVPVLVALGGAVLLAEPLTSRLVLAAFAVLGGIAMVVMRRVPVA